MNADNKPQAQAVADARGRALLVMYWPDEGGIQRADVRELRKFLKAQGLTRQEKLERLDVLIETPGGDAEAPYLIGQMLRDYADKIGFLVRNQAVSAGTEICLAGDYIVLGDDATLSPIDTQFLGPDGNWWSETVIEHFRELADGASTEECSAAIIENTIGRISPDIIAQAYRTGRIAAQHAEKLLNQYMLHDAAPEQITGVLNSLTRFAPSHEWAIDYHLAKEIGLKVKRMDEELCDLTGNLVAQIKCEITVGDRSDGKAGDSAYFMYATPSA